MLESQHKGMGNPPPKSFFIPLIPPFIKGARGISRGYFREIQRGILKRDHKTFETIEK